MMDRGLWIYQINPNELDTKTNSIICKVKISIKTGRFTDSNVSCIATLILSEIY